MLLRAAVDVVLSGHIHAFQRSCRMARGACVAAGERGIVYHTNGAAGMAFSLERQDQHAHFAQRVLIGLHGISLIEAANSTALRLSFAANRNGSVIDDVWLTKQP